MATTEHTINDALAAVLRETRHAWRTPDVVKSENTGMLVGSNARPDILVCEPNVSPVVIETEVLPAATVELEATMRLGEKVRTNGRTILSAIAMRLPLRLRQKQGSALQTELKSATDLEMALYTGSAPTSSTRWPRFGWITGSVADLSLLVQSASVPPDVIEEAVTHLVNGVSAAAGLLGEIARVHPGAISSISRELRQDDAEQTRRMAATILTNAVVFQESLAGGPGALATVQSLDQLRSAGGLSKPAILAEWRKILTVNYWPIFDIARRILEVLPTAESGPLLDGLSATAEKLLANRLMRSHDLTGAVFQRLIADRKFLAAYYTTPASAALLVGLAITRDRPLSPEGWAEAAAVQALRVADFACGTGTLLSTAYGRIGQLHELAGGDAEALHPQMMASALVGCDVLPSAAHLTASMLAGAHPTVTYGQSSILTVAYGRQPDGSPALGSLDLLSPQRKLAILSITARAVEAMGETERETWQALPHESFDVVLMNPPFTRATVHEAERLNVPNPMFAAFSSSPAEQQEMGTALERLKKGTSANGNAGGASYFLVLADRKLKWGGVLALVMPLSLLAGDAWEDSRALLARTYRHLVLISIAGGGSDDMSFSADTGMGECLVVGQKAARGSKRATFVVLNERPTSPLMGTMAAEQIRQMIATGGLRRLEDGPVGGTPLIFGSDQIGQALDAPLPPSGGWNLARISDIALAQTAYQLADNKRLWLPTMREVDAVEVPITTVAAMGSIGPIHRDIDGHEKGEIRGPFDIVPVRPNSAPTYPALWAHHAKRERTMSFDADCEGMPRQGVNAEEQTTLDHKVISIWTTASHCHFNCDFQFNSQPVGMQFTPRRSIGGRAWLSIRLAAIEQEKALVLWANTSLGLLLRWWHSNKQQAGRGNIGKSTLHTLPVLDVTVLTSVQLAAAVTLFDRMCAQPLLPIHEIDKDPVRRELDERFGREVLGLPESLLTGEGPLDLLRRKLSREPSIRGRK